MSEQTDKLLEVLQELRATSDRAAVQALWKSAFGLLKKSPVEANRAANVVAGRNIEGLAKIVAELRAAEEPPAQQQGAVVDAVQAAAVHDAADEEVLKAAMKLFRRRLKFAKLDEESRLGRGPIGSGHRIQNLSIEPPAEYPRAVWEALARQGQLRPTGQGFYQLVGEE